jgi:hypothetical protein
MSTKLDGVSGASIVGLVLLSSNFSMNAVTDASDAVDSDAVAHARAYAVANAPFVLVAGRASFRIACRSMIVRGFLRVRASRSLAGERATRVENLHRLHRIEEKSSLTI